MCIFWVTYLIICNIYSHFSQVFIVFSAILAVTLSQGGGPGPRGGGLGGGFGGGIGPSNVRLGVGLGSSGGGLSGGLRPHGGGGYYEPTYESGPAKYKYAYGVDAQDPYGNYVQFGQNEARDGYSTYGEYHVQLPDGRLQTVKYTVADAYSGYVADVSYSGEPHYGPADGSGGSRLRGVGLSLSGLRGNGLGGSGLSRGGLGPHEGGLGPRVGGPGY
jgi:hypothetical protein